MKKIIFFLIAVCAAFTLPAGEAQKIMLYPPGHPEIDGENFAPYVLLYPADIKRGTVLILPGGGYRARASAREGVQVAEKFQELGFNTAVLEYRVAPSRYPAPQRDVLRAIKLLRANAAKWRIDPNHIAVLGFSAGGHLAGCAGVLYDRIEVKAGDEADAASARPDAMILCYPVISLADDFAHRGSGQNLLGENATPENLKKLSLQHLVNQNTPPVFLWHTATDNSVPAQNSIVFAQAMWEKKLTAELHIFTTGNHGKDLAKKLPTAWQWPQMAARFLVEVARFPAGE
ncbi:MAG: alpha/beta hydrolase [Victivallaceae bacterium]|nr:alpha/beta hydrolase [Victivallaceae bacterium]